jgi:hypothetical protein
VFCLVVFAFLASFRWDFAACKAVVESIWVITEAFVIISSHVLIVFSSVPSLRDFRAVSAKIMLGVYASSAFSIVLLLYCLFGCLSATQSMHKCQLRSSPRSSSVNSFILFLAMPKPLSSTALRCFLTSNCIVSSRVC